MQYIAKLGLNNIKQMKSIRFISLSTFCEKKKKEVIFTSAFASREGLLPSHIDFDSKLINNHYLF